MQGDPVVYFSTCISACADSLHDSTLVMNLPAKLIGFLLSNLYASNLYWFGQSRLVCEFVE